MLTVQYIPYVCNGCICHSAGVGGVDKYVACKHQAKTLHLQLNRLCNETKDK